MAARERERQMNGLTVNSIQSIEQIVDVTEAVNVNKHAMAAAVIYKAQGDLQRMQDMKRIYLESARRAGELLLEAERRPGVRGHEVTDYQEAIDGAGITRYVAHTWQKLAQIDRKKWDEYFVEGKYQWTEYTIKGLISYATGKRESVITQEGMLKIIAHWLKRYTKEYPGIDDTVLLQNLFWKVLRGEWKAE